MQNMLQLQDDLKNFSEQQLVREMQMPSGQVPQFLILTELGRRKRMKDDFTRQQAANSPTVAEETVAAAGMPVGEATGIAKSMAPKTSMAENTGIGTMMPRQPTRMAGGGVVKMQAGGLSFIPDRALPLGEGGYNRGTGRATMVDGVFVKLLPSGRVVDVRTGDTVPQEIAAKAIAKLTPNVTEDDAAKAEATVPTIYDTSIGMPTQADLDLKNVSDTRNEAVGIGTSDNPISVDLTQDVVPTAPTLTAGPSVKTSSPTTVSSPDVMQRDYGVTELVMAEGLPTVPDTVSPSEAGLDPTQVEINRLRAIISDPLTSTPERANAAEDLQALQERIAITRTGGDVSSTVAGQGIETPEGFVMTALGPQPDPNYTTPGKTGQSIVDQAALQGTENLNKLAESGLYPDNIIREAEKSAKLADFEAGIYDINKDIMDVQKAISNPYLSDDARAEMEDFVKLANQQKNTLATQKGVSSNLFTPPDTTNITGGYEGLIDTSSIVDPSAPTSKPASATTPELTFGTGTAGAGDLPLSLGDTATRDIGAPNKTVKINDRTISPTTTGTSISTGGVGGMGGIEGQLADMLKDMDKARDQDKWLALANTGLALMASKQPTLGGALGEAGMAGIKQLREGKKQYSKDKMTVLALQQRIDAAKLAASSRASASNAALARLGLSIDKENRLASQAEMDRTLDKLNTLGGVDRIRVLQNADDLSPSEAQELLMLQGLYDTVFGGSTGAKAVNVAG